MKDTLVRATAGGVKIYAAKTTELVEDACSRHGCWPIAAAALGRTMTGALFIAATLKNQDRVSIQIDGDGPLGKIFVDAGQMSVRGYVENPKADLPSKNGKIDVGGGVGKGTLTVTRFTGLKTPFSGSSELVNGEIAADMTKYLFESEQTPSSVALGVLVGTEGKVLQAGGFFVQAMPDASEDILIELENNIKNLPSVTNMMEQDMTPVDIIERICGKSITPTIHDENDVFFKCYCSKDKIKGIFQGLPKNEIEGMLEDDETEVICHYCNNKYIFNHNDLHKILRTGT